MKDEHDKATLELVPPAPVDMGKALAKLKALGERMGKEPAFAFPFAVVEPQAVKHSSVITLTPRFLQPSWLPVSHVARDWGVSMRRVRVLLDGGRLEGRKQDNGYWEVKFPYSLTAGTRGPASRREVKKVERMQERLK